MVVQFRYRVHDAMAVHQEQSGGISDGRSTEGRRGSTFMGEQVGSTLLEATESLPFQESHLVSLKGQAMRWFLVIING